MTKRLIFVLGGARSGKSSYAESRVQENSAQVLYVATAQAFDDDMRARIANHQAQRPANWQTLEAPLNAGRAITEALAGHDTVLLDCMTVLTANALLQLPEDCSQAEADAVIQTEIDGLLAAIADSDATWVIVSNEVGMGVVPPYNLGRVYRDALGRANQQIASIADEVLLLVAGLPWQLK
jgi:adenosylcobinamide kinase/adenosylcobinamide-phosphate guanylyltransferase